MVWCGDDGDCGGLGCKASQSLYLCTATPGPLIILYKIDFTFYSLRCYIETKSYLTNGNDNKAMRTTVLSLSNEKKKTYKVKFIQKKEFIGFTKLAQNKGQTPGHGQMEMTT